MDQQRLALIVAPPGLLREGLCAALSASRLFDAVKEADSVAQATSMIHAPLFVLLSVEGPEQGKLASVSKIKGHWPAAQCIVLVDTVAQQQAARATGAEEVVIKGVRPDKLLKSIEGLLSGEENSF
jgi:DNA-binding NarL/FixJ family response regulator